MHNESPGPMGEMLSTRMTSLVLEPPVLDLQEESHLEVPGINNHPYAKVLRESGRAAQEASGAHQCQIDLQVRQAEATSPLLHRMPSSAP